MVSASHGTADVHIIVHGKMALIEKVKELLSRRNFEIEKMRLASLDKAGNPGEYVAMLWPPWDPKEIIVSEITSKTEGDDQKQSEMAMAMGAWSSVGQKEIFRIDLT